MNIKNLLSFNRREKRGAVVFIFLILSVIIFNKSFAYFQKDEPTNFSEFKSEIKQFEEEQIAYEKSNEHELFEFNPNTISDKEWRKLGFKEWQIKTINNYKSKGGKWKIKSDLEKIYGLDIADFEKLKPFILLPDNFKKKRTPPLIEEHIRIAYFKFNPNTISDSDWQKLGFKEWQIKSINNYKNKGGIWRIKSDVKKLYGLNDVDYKKLKPYILLPEEKIIKNDATKVNINTSSPKELMALKGIQSEKYAAVIVKYRTSLGGFIRKDQLKEVWNLTEETYNGFEHQLEISTPQLTQININSSSANELVSHPYINWKTANAIEKYRKANGYYKNVEDLKKIHLINDETYLRIIPYLKINK